MLRELDELDKALMQAISEKPGSCVREICRPFLLQRSESVLRERIRGLELRKLVNLTQTKKEVLVYPKEE